jgi:uncharacterized phage-like protein YoqJ
MLTIATTGHRPNNQYLGGYDLTSNRNMKIMAVLEDYFNDIIKDALFSGETEITFIFGGAIGIDTLGYIVAKNLRDKVYLKGMISIILAMPFENQDGAWFRQEDKDRLRYQRIVADSVVQVDKLPKYAVNYTVGEYHPLKMQKRNEYMVDNSDIVVAVWDGSKKGGTYNCVKYAKANNKKIIHINPKDI